MPTRPGCVRRARAALTAVAVVGVVALGACGGGDVRLSDLPPDVASARPTITAEEARFVLDAREKGVDVTGASVADDIETGTTVCWALKSGGVELHDIAVDEEKQPLGNEGEQLRTKRLMAAAVESLCPDYADQISQLKLP